ncbi:MAG: aldolase/citrate lyase family protein [bacterium]
MPLKLMYITNQPQVAKIAEKNGVEWIWIDLETIGKDERQKGKNSVKSHHSIEDIKIIKPLLTTSLLLVRVNPWNEKSKLEINAVIDAKADMIMLPMWKTVKEVQDFISTINGRAKTMLLLETKEAVECLDEVLKISGIDEIHIGLNDLHLSYCKTFMFELLADGTIERLCNKIRTVGLPYGFGGIAKIGDGILPAEKIILEHYRLGSTRVILSRTFCDYTLIDSFKEIESVFRNNIKRLRIFEKYAATASDVELLKNKFAVIENVENIVKKIKRSNVYG